MSKILIPIANQRDIEILAGKVHGLKSTGYTHIWIVYSPAAAVNQDEARNKFDQEIQQILEAEKQATIRRDYEGAQGYKIQHDAKVLERDVAVRDAWKALQPQERIASMREKLGPVFEVLKNSGLNGRATECEDHHEPEALDELLRRLKPSWPAGWDHGTYSVSYPAGIPVGEKSNPNAVAPEIRIEAPAAAPAPVVVQKPAPAAPVRKKEAAPKVFASREDELMSMRYFGLVSVAKKAGVDPTGKKGPQIIAEILEKESALQPA